MNVIKIEISLSFWLKSSSISKMFSDFFVSYYRQVRADFLMAQAYDFERYSSRHLIYIFSLKIQEDSFYAINLSLIIFLLISSKFWNIKLKNVNGFSQKRYD